jgi:hypothetical protein
MGMVREIGCRRICGRWNAWFKVGEFWRRIFNGLEFKVRSRARSFKASAGGWFQGLYTVSLRTVIKMHCLKFLLQNLGKQRERGYPTKHGQ